MPLGSFNHTGDTTLTDIVAAGGTTVTWQVMGLAITASGAGTVTIKNGTTVVFVLTSPGAVVLGPSDSWEFPAASAANTSISVTNSANGVQSSGSVLYRKVPS